MMLVDFLVERYEKENVPKLSDLPTEQAEEAEGTEEASVESDDEWEILEIRDLTPEEMKELEKNSPGCHLRMERNRGGYSYLLLNG